MYKKILKCTIECVLISHSESWLYSIFNNIYDTVLFYYIKYSSNIVIQYFVFHVNNSLHLQCYVLVR